MTFVVGSGFLVRDWSARFQAVILALVAWGKPSGLVIWPGPGV
jgi:hypothetical protein